MSEKDRPINNEMEDDLRLNYDFDYSKSKPNRFAEKYNKMVCRVGLEADVAEEFPTEESVNDALRDYIRITRQNSPDIPAR
ncbi:MAG: hypothetical protein ACRD6X_07735 [Pyrinomonadaceae bacterium]